MQAYREMSDNEALVRALAEKAREGRRSVAVWVRENYELLTEARQRDGVTLPALTEVAAELGIKDGWGNPPSVMSIWRAFKRVEGERRVSGTPTRDRDPSADKPFEFRTLRQHQKKRG